MVAGTEDPTVLDRRFRAQLRKLRDEADLTQRDVAAAMDWSVSKLIRIESGAVGISSNDLRVLLPYYGVTDSAEIQALIDASKAGRQDPWAGFKDVHSPTFFKYVGFEAVAKHVYQFESSLIPGLLQIEEYAAVTLDDVYQTDSNLIERKWQVRQRRQEVHESSDPPKMSFILDEAVLRREVGGKPIMHNQLERLLYWADQPHITLLVLPFSAGAQPGMLGPFVLLEFEEDDDLIYLEDAVGSTIVRDDPGETGQRRELFSLLEGLALSKLQSRDFIKDLTSALSGPKPKTRPTKQS